MTTEEEIFQLFEHGVSFSEGGGDDSHGISYGYNVTVSFDAGQYKYVFFEDQNNVRITDISVVLSKDKILEQIHTINQNSAEDILRNLRRNKADAVYYKLENLLNKGSIILKSNNETITIFKSENPSEMKVVEYNQEKIVNRYQWITDNPILLDQLLFNK
jgi:hypothetical protein